MNEAPHLTRHPQDGLNVFVMSSKEDSLELSGEVYGEVADNL